MTLTPSDHNGYNISCFGGRNGTIDATVTGGTAPYTYVWTNGASTEDITDLAAGYYKLKVSDANNDEASAEITLEEPIELKLTAEPFTYANGYNISCRNCFNGSIDVSLENGVAPYTYAWGDGVLTQDRTGLGASNYGLVATDANGCEVRSENLALKEPERDDWQMGGNANTDPNAQFIGTTDEQDVVFKSNATERLRLNSNGEVSLLGSAAIGKGYLYLDDQGVLKGGGYPYMDPLPEGLCHQYESYPFWETRGNFFEDLCEGVIPKLGTRSGHPLRIITDNQQRMIVMTDGRVGIGTVPTTEPGTYKLFVEGGIATRDVLVKLGTWPDYVFKEGYHLLSPAELRSFLKANGHLPGIPSAAEVEAQGGVEVGDLQRRMLEVVEQQALYILQLEERLTRMEQRLLSLEAQPR